MKKFFCIFCKKVVLGVCAAAIVAVAAVCLSVNFNSKSIVGLTLNNVSALADAESGNPNWFSKKRTREYGPEAGCDNGYYQECTQYRITCVGFGIYITCNQSAEMECITYDRPCD